MAAWPRIVGVKNSISDKHCRVFGIYLSDIVDVPQIEAAIAVDARHFVVGLVVTERHRVGIFGIGWMRGHVTDGETFGDIHTEVVRPRQSGYKLQGEWAETAHDTIGATDKNVLLAYH